MTKFLDTEGLKYFYNQLKSKFAAASHSHGNMKGATSGAAGAAGFVPTPSAGAATRYLRSDGTWQVPPDTNTTYSDATQSAHGLMTAADKKKLDGIATGANAYTHPNSGVTAGTYRNVTVNAQGHVTGGSNPTLAIANGGTGQTTAAAALKALIGSSAIGSSTKPLYYDGAALKACADSIGGGGIVAQLLEQNGYVKFANGLILQWGLAEKVPTAINYSIPLNISVNSGLYGDITPCSAPDIAMGNNAVISISVNTMTVFSRQPSFENFRWFVIGL